MTPLTALGILGAGTAAGAVNTVVGSGSLITFPTLLAAGYEPVTANVSNNIGLVPGSVSGVLGYRRELEGQAPRIRHLGVASLVGSITGAVLLLVLPDRVFDGVVPVLVLVACVLMALQPRLRTWMAARRPDGGHGGAGLFVTVFLTGVYGGYFGAAQGVILMALLSTFLGDHLQRLNALKNVLAGLVNGVAAVVFIVFADVAWTAAAVIAVGAVIGAHFGARVGRRIPAELLRLVVIAVGLAAFIKLVLD